MKRYYIYYQYRDDKDRYSLITVCESFREAKNLFNTDYNGFISVELTKDNKTITRVLKRYQANK